MTTTSERRTSSDRTRVVVPPSDRFCVRGTGASVARRGSHARTLRPYPCGSDPTSRSRGGASWTRRAARSRRRASTHGPSPANRSGRRRRVFSRIGEAELIDEPAEQRWSRRSPFHVHRAEPQTLCPRSGHDLTALRDPNDGAANRLIRLDREHVASRKVERLEADDVGISPPTTMIEKQLVAKIVGKRRMASSTVAECRGRGMISLASRRIVPRGTSERSL